MAYTKLVRDIVIAARKRAHIFAEATADMTALSQRKYLMFESGAHVLKEMEMRSICGLLALPVHIVVKAEFAEKSVPGLMAQLEELHRHLQLATEAATVG